MKMVSVRPLKTSQLVVKVRSAISYDVIGTVLQSVLEESKVEVFSE